MVQEKNLGNPRLSAVSASECDPGCACDPSSQAARRAALSPPARLPQSERLFALIMDHGPAAIAMFDRNMNYIAASARWRANFGLTEDPVGRSHYEIFPEIPEAWRAVHRRVQAGATESSPGEPFERKDGRFQWVRWEARPWRDDSGDVGGIIISSEDITERKEAEAAAAGLAAIVTNAHDAIIGLDLRSTVTSWNAGAERLFGYSAAEMIGNPVIRIVPSALIDEEAEFMRRVQAGESLDHYETSRAARDGRRIEVSVTVSPVKNALGAVIGASKILRDITESKRAEQAARENEKRKSFLLGFADALKPLRDPDDIKETASALLGREIGGDQVLYAEIDASDQFAIITRDWNDGRMPSPLGVHRLDNFGPGLIADLRAGRTVAIDDISADSRTCSPKAQATFGSRSIGALIIAPLVKDGRLTCVMSVYARRARRWSPAEIALAEDVAERTLPWVERANVEKALRASLREIVDLKTALDAHAIVAFVDPNGAITFVNDKFCEVFGFSRAELFGKTHRIVNSGHHPKSFFAELWQTISAGKVWRGELRNRAKDGSVHWVDTAIVPFLDDAGRPLQYVAVHTEITARKQMEDDLRRSRALLAAVFAQMPIAFAVTDAEGHFVLKNSRIDRFATDRVASRDDANFSRWRVWDANGRLVSRDMYPTARALRGEAASVEALFRTFDDAEMWTRVSATPLRDEAGAVTGSIVIVDDINQAKLAEEALRDSEERLRFALQGARAAAWRWNIQDGQIVWSERGGVLYGRDAAPATYDAWLETVHPDDRTRANANVMAALESHAQEYRTEYRILLPSGEIRWLLTVGKVDFSETGAPVRMTGLNLDVTHQKQAEMAIRQNEAALRQGQTRLRHATDAAMLTFSELDLIDGRAHLAHNFAQVVGFQPVIGVEGGDVDAAFAHLLEHVAPPDRSRVAKAFADIRREGAPLRLEYCLIGEDGAQRWIESVCKTEFDPEGRPARAFVTYLDITGRKAAETALREAKQEAERANRAKSKFLAAASHDLRQPVQSLVLLLSLIERQIAAIPRAVETAQMMKQALGGLNGLLTAILDISRLDAGVVEPANENVDLFALITRLGGEYATAAQAKGLDLRIAPRSVHALADPALLERALRNLIENALRYTPDGGLLIGLRPRGERVRIDVIDTGIGVPVERRREIFDEFIQLNNPGRDLAKGLGLGLAIVARLVALMDGEIEVGSHGRGSRFSLTLPRAEAAPKLEADLASGPNPTGRVLIVEDNVILRHGLESIASQWGCETHSAPDGEAAVDLAESLDWQMDAIITDYRLGAGMNGVQAAREIVRRSGRSVPTLILTGDTAKNRIAEIASSGFELLHKPVSAEDLRRKLRQMLR
jgi:PAS domain S-box-containing protein